MLRVWPSPLYMKMNICLLSLPLPFLRKQEIVVHAFTRGRAVPWTWKHPGAISALSCWACESALLQCSVCRSTHGARMLRGGRDMARGPVDLSSYSKCDHRTAAWPWSWAEMPNLQPHPDLLSLSMQYNQTPRGSCALTLKHRGTLTSIFIENMPRARQ